MTKIVLLNGPPGCGKDFAGAMIKEDAPGRLAVGLLKFAEVVKEGTHAAYGLVYPHDDGRPYEHDHYEAVKNDPHPDFRGRSPRECYIAYSEAFMKPLHGLRVFGEILAEQHDWSIRNVPVSVITDSGFREEAEVLVERFGAGNCFLARIHREGKTFAGDSRSWVHLEDLGVASLDVTNPGTPEGLRTALAPILEWIKA